MSYNDDDLEGPEMSEFVTSTIMVLLIAAGVSLLWFASTRNVRAELETCKAALAAEQSMSVPQGW